MVLHSVRGRLSQQAKQKRPGQSKIKKERSARQVKNQATRKLKCLRLPASGQKHVPSEQSGSQKKKCLNAEWAEWAVLSGQIHWSRTMPPDHAWPDFWGNSVEWWTALCVVTCHAEHSAGVPTFSDNLRHAINMPKRTEKVFLLRLIAAYIPIIPPGGDVWSQEWEQSWSTGAIRQSPEELGRFCGGSQAGLMQLYSMKWSLDFVIWTYSENMCVYIIYDILLLYIYIYIHTTILKLRSCPSHSLRTKRISSMWVLRRWGSMGMQLEPVVASWNLVSYTHNHT